jgi:hypothetical protein
MHLLVLPACRCGQGTGDMTEPGGMTEPTADDPDAVR